MTTENPITFSIHIPRNLLAAVAEAAPPKPDMRHYLNSVMVEIDAQADEVRLTASDGAIMVTTKFPLHNQAEIDGIEGTHNFLVPIDMLKIALKNGPSKASTVRLTEQSIGLMPYTPIQGRIIDVARAWPIERSTTFCPINPVLWVRVAKIVAKGGNRRYTSVSGGKAVVFRCDMEGVELRGVIMGLTDALLETLPAF